MSAKITPEKKAERLARYEEVRQAVEAFRQAGGVRDCYLRNYHQFPKVVRQTTFDVVSVRTRPFMSTLDERAKRVNEVFDGTEERLANFLAARGFACLFDYPEGLTFWVVRNTEEVAPWILNEVLTGRMKLRVETPCRISDALVAAKLAALVEDGLNSERKGVAE
jgi:hypothetical protein